MMKRAVSWVLMVCLLMSLVLPMSVSASETETTVPPTTEATAETVPTETILETEPAEETAPVTEETVVVTEETIPVTEETVPATEETVPATEETAPAADEIQAMLETSGLLDTSRQVLMLEETVSDEALGAVPMGAPAVNWIDRIANLPTYARNFYNWLVENSDGDGAHSDDDLFNPATGITMENYPGCFYAEVARLSNIEITFVYDPDATEEENTAIIAEAIERDCGAWIDEVYSYVPAVYGAFLRDHPEVFWLSGECVWELFYEDMYVESVSGNTCKATYTLAVYFDLMYPGFDIRHEDYLDVSEVTSSRVARDNAVAKITKGAVGSRYEQVKYLNNWLTTNNCYNTSYDLSALSADSTSCISALLGSTGTEGPICEGYAGAFKVLCDALGIPCVLVDGVAGNENHMWNYVQMEDGNWYAVDVTWNDPSVSGVSGAVSGYENEDYLLVGSDTIVDGMAFSGSHALQNMPMNDGSSFTNGPTLSRTKYEPHIHNYVPTVTPPTCTAQGYTTYACACGDSYVDNYVVATGVHTYADEKDATCDVCGEVRTIQLPIAPEGEDYTPMYRLYNPNSGEHFYTGSTEETQNLVKAGWNYEGVAWNAPISEGEPVYRLFNPNNGDHHYTMSQEEVDMLVGYGWQYEGVAWNSAGSDNVPQYRLFNPNADCGSHHYTSSVEERDYLVSLGWHYEGIGWYGLA